MYGSEKVNLMFISSQINSSTNPGAAELLAVLHSF